MGERVRAFDWARTPLGPMEGWPAALRTAVDICLNSPVPMFVWWGPELINIYNDGYAPVLGKRHPEALGMPARQIWADIWPHIGADVDRVVRLGEAVSKQRVRFIMERNGYPEETFFSYSHSPIPDGDGGIGGLFQVCTDETAQVRMERELLEASRRSDSALIAGEVGTFEWDIVTDRLWGDENFARIFGIALDVSGAAPLDKYVAAIHPEDRDRVMSLVRRAVETGGVYEAEYRIVSGERERWVIARGQVERDAERRAVRFPGAVLEITAQKLAEQERERLANQRQVALDAARLGWWHYDPQTKVATFDQRYAEIFGVAGQQRPNDEILKRLHPDDLPRVWAKVEAALDPADPKPYAAEYRIVRDDGSIRWIEAHGSATFAGDGKDRRATSFVGTVSDITDRKQAEAAVRESESRYRTLFDSIDDGFCVFEMLFDDAARPIDYRFIEVNPAFERHTGITNAAGRRMREIAPNHEEHWFQTYGRVAVTGEPVRFENTAGALGGRTYDLYAFRDGRPEQRRVAVLFRDISGQRQAEEERKQLLASERAARAEAERASEAKSEFLATLSHELRTPLTPVMLTVSLMESHPHLPSDLREDVAAIRRNVELESRLISDLLDLTRITRGKLQLEQQEVDLHLVIRSAIDICQREASARLTADLKANRHTVMGDSTRLQQVFWNLINNAIKFTPDDGMIIVRSSNSDDGRIRVEVVDTGAGIDPAVLPKLFNAFEQGEVRAARQQAGLGLGLAISRKLAEAHAGTIVAASRGRGHGATFTVDLPIVKQRFRATHAAPQHAAPAPMAARPMHVLLVEDHEPTLRVMERLLRQIGHRVTGVTSVASATAAAAEDGFDLIISDLGLPDGSGLDVMRRLREKYTGRAIALTGYGMESDIEASRDAGFAEHLTKPVDLAALDAAIRRVSRSAF